MSIRHNCETQGCFIKVATVDWGFLDNSFSGRIKIGDIDGIVEANGRLLILEWKGINVPTPKGQHIMFTNITKISKIIVFVINGDTLLNKPTHIKIYKHGRIAYDRECNEEKLKELCTSWEKKARSGEI